MFLKKLKQKTLLSNALIIAADFETIIIQNKHYVYAAGVLWNKTNWEYMYFKDDVTEENIEIKSNKVINNFITFLLNINGNKQTIVYFHNLSGFDGIFLIKTINKDFKELKKKIVIKNNNIYLITIANITFLDSLHILKASLNKLANIYLNKSKDSFDVTTIKSISDIQIYKNKILKYLHVDVQLLYNIVLLTRDFFYKNYTVDITKNYTISSIAMKIYRMHFFTEDHSIEICKHYRYLYIKKSYFGGLCGLTETTSSNGFVYDVNSLYPYIMKTRSLPKGKGIFRYNLEIEEINNIYGFVKCTVYVPKTLPIPPLVSRLKDKTLIQAHGYIEGTWYTEEVKYAISLGCVLQEIESALVYKEKGLFFTDFVEEFSTLKEKSNNIVDRFLYKNILNSLYGRFGMNLDRSETIWAPTVEETFNIEHVTESVINTDNKLLTYTISNNLYEKVVINNNYGVNRKTRDWLKHKKLISDVKESNSISCIQIASAISSESRIMLLKQIYSQISKGNKVYYYDTDSIYTNKPIDSKLIHNRTIGFWKLEYEYKEAVFVSPKNYGLLLKDDTEVIKFKGLQEGHKQDITINDLYKFLRKNEILRLPSLFKPINSSLKKLNITTRWINYSSGFKTHKYKKIYNKLGVFTHIEYLYLKKTKFKKIKKILAKAYYNIKNL